MGRKPGREGRPRDALSRLGKCRPQLDQARDELLKAVERLDDQADHLDAGLRRDAVEAELRTVSQTANRAVYFASWANFYERLLSPAATGEGFRVARLGFRRLLGIEDRPLTADDFDGLDAEINARITLGLALSELATGQPESARTAFRVLRPRCGSVGSRLGRPLASLGAAPGKSRWRAGYPLLRLRSIGSRRPSLRPRWLLCMLLLQGVGSPDLKDRLAILGLRGLVRIGRSDLARRSSAAETSRQLAAPDGFAHWLRGQAALSAAERGSGRPWLLKRTGRIHESRSRHRRSRPWQRTAASARHGAISGWAIRREHSDGFRHAASELKAQGLSAADAEWMAILADWSLADGPPEERSNAFPPRLARSSRHIPNTPGGSR